MNETLIHIIGAPSLGQIYKVSLVVHWSGILCSLATCLVARPSRLNVHICGDYTCFLTE